MTNLFHILDARFIRKIMVKVMRKNSLIYVTGLILLIVVGCSQKETTNDPMGWKAGTFWSKWKTPHVLYNRTIGEESNIIWSTGNHTASPLPLGAIGPKKYTKQLKGIFQNTHIAEVTKEAVKDGKKVILVIGDGMGINHMSLPILNNIAQKTGKETYFEKIMNEGENAFVINNVANGLVTGSAAAATAIACGTKTITSMIGVDPDGKPLTSVLDVAEKRGMPTGLVTEASILDGTPGGFYANNISRHAFDEISVQLCDEYNIEVLFGGGAEYFIPKGKSLTDYDYFKDITPALNGPSKRKDDRDLINDFAKKGYQIINTKEELTNLSDKTEKTIGLFAAGGMNAAIDRDEEETGEPSLVDMASKSINILSKSKKGFFLMVEAARIDWEAHDNDAGSVYKAVEEMNRVLKVCYDYYKEDPKNTLVIFTADHETGGFALSYNHFHGDKKYTRKLANGETFSSGYNPLLNEEFHKLTEQKKSLYKIFGEVHSAEELYNQLKENTSYNITREDAEVIFSTTRNYKKAK